MTSRIQITGLWFWDSPVSLYVVKDFKEWRFEPNEMGGVRAIFPFDGDIRHVPRDSRIYFDAASRQILRIEEYQWWDRRYRVI